MIESKQNRDAMASKNLSIKIAFRAQRSDCTPEPQGLELRLRPRSSEINEDR